MASSSSSSVHNKKYDVFISFRGSDIRQGFLSHLQKALTDQKIEAFVDEQLERGKEISESLLAKIEESHISVVIFSQNYAYSEWCLEELLKITECQNTARQIVLPVFYSVDPSHVQDLSGSYGDAMAQHRTKFDETMVESWGNVLKETASLSGLVSSNFKTDSSLIEEIIQHINHILEKLNCLYPKDSGCDGGLVGINSRVKEVLSLLCGSEDVHVVGVWGEGGIGKTTLARAIFDRICSHFDSQCFVENVREKSEKFTAGTIQNEVVSNLFGTTTSYMTRKRLSRKKVILVLDDVSDLDQIKPFIRYKDDFGPGSRIIITSRDSHLLNILDAKIYAVEKLDNREALKLFCMKAFNKKAPEEGYLELCERAVEYAQGLPLALEVLGSNLFQRNAEEWEDELEKLKGTSDQKIHKILRISFDRLPEVEKEIFLDIACFLKWRRRDEVESMLDVRGSKIGTSRLSEKALISISADNRIEMHDLIQQMAKDIICEEKTAEKRRWLWDPEEIFFLLTREMGTGAVRGISLDMSKIRNINWSPTTFLKLYNLKYLDFYASRWDKAQVCVPHGLEYLPEQLRYLRWDQYPFQSLPLAEKLVELKMSDSQLEELWNGVPNLQNLKRIVLSSSRKLIKVPDLSRASNLEDLYLDGCLSLVEIPSLKYLNKLNKLNLHSCTRLESIPDDICNLKSLWLLNVSYCVKLHRLPQNLGDLDSLNALMAGGSGLIELPESLCSLKKLRELEVNERVNLHRLPHCMVWYWKYCTRLAVSLGLPQNLGNLESLQYLNFAGRGIKEVPSSINNMRELKILNFYGCKGLILPPLTGDFPYLGQIDLTKCGISEFPIGLCSVTSLKCLNLGGNSFESIPESIQYLSKLETLDLHDCKKLKYLPEIIQLLPLGKVDLRECISLDQHQCSKIMNHLVMNYVEDKRQYYKPKRIWYPGSEVAEKMKHRNEFGSSLSFSFEVPQNLGVELGFYACVVLDGRFYDVRCKGNFMDEFGLGYSEEGSDCSHFNMPADIQSKHVHLKAHHFSTKNIVKGRKYTAEFQFLCRTTKPDVDEYGQFFSVSNNFTDGEWSSDGIIKCGVFPLFDHHTIH